MNTIVDLNISQARTRIFTVFQKKQNGKCRHCKRNTTLSDIGLVTGMEGGIITLIMILTSHEAQSQSE